MLLIEVQLSSFLCSEFAVALFETSRSCAYRISNDVNLLKGQVFVSSYTYLASLFRK